MSGNRISNVSLNKKNNSQNNFRSYLINIGIGNDLRPQTLNEPVNLEFGSTLGVSFRSEDESCMQKEFS